MQQARDATSGVVVASRLRCADTHWTRLFGLLGTKDLPSGDGLWLKRSRQVHMIGMRYPIDVAFLDDGLQILRTISALPPGTVSPRVAGATSVLELPAGTLGLVGAFLPLLLRPGDGAGPLARLAEPLQAVGLLITLAGVFSLGRSFGLIAADRGIKTHGVYRLVRHPLYAGYLLGYLGYLGVYPSLWNCVLTVGTAVALNCRALVEERFLARDPAYREYLRRVRWRFLPSVY